jgi:hypothetical protein
MTSLIDAITALLVVLLGVLTRRFDIQTTSVLPQRAAISVEFQV